ncbi:MAG: LamG domain-containing protein [Dolichospermum sp.]
MPGNPTINSHTILPLITTCKIQANVTGNYGEPSIRIKYGTAIGALNNVANGDTLFFGKWDPNPTGTLTANLSGLISSTKYYCQIEIFHTTGLTILLDSFNTISSNVDTSGLLAYYSFENNFNSYNNIHNLSSATATTAGFATGKIGQCATFNGLQTLTNTSIATVFNDNEFTIAFWAYRTANGSYATSYELFGSNFIRNRNSGNREIGMAYTSTLFAIGGSGTEGVNLNAWHHYAFVFKQSGANMFFYNYVNGVLIDSVLVGTGNTSLHRFNNVFAVGGGTDAGGTINGLKYFTGKIDEFCIFKRALTMQQVFVLASKTNDLLPTTITQFTAIKKENTAQLRWTSENE